MYGKQEGLQAFPRELTGGLDVAAVAQGARLWHRVKGAPPKEHQVSRTSALGV